MFLLFFPGGVATTGALISAFWAFNKVRHACLFHVTYVYDFKAE